MVVTDDPDLAQRARHLTTTGKVPHPWRFDHDAIAWNYRMPNLNAALGCAQLESLPGMLTAKRRLADRYAAAFGSDVRLRFVAEPAGTTSNYWLCTVELPAGVDIEDALSALHERGFMCRPTWTPLSYLPMYLGSQRGALATTEMLARTLINLPSSAHLAEPIEA